MTLNRFLLYGRNNPPIETLSNILLVICKTLNEDILKALGQLKDSNDLQYFSNDTIFPYFLSKTYLKGKIFEKCKSFAINVS